MGNVYNLFTDIMGETSPSDRNPKKKRSVLKKILNFLSKFFIFYVKHKKLVKFIFNASFLLIVLLILKKILHDFIY